MPDAIVVDGKSFLLDTDFRKWIDLGHKLQLNDCKIVDMLKLIKSSEDNYVLFNDTNKFIEEMIKFYSNENSTPKKDGGGNERIIDYVEDGEYIVASFMQAYNIDLTTCDMHWHLFKALFLGLPDNTKIKEIMTMRGWSKKDIKYEEQCRKNREIWRLPRIEKDDDRMKEINELFYGC